MPFKDRLNLPVDATGRMIRDDDNQKPQTGENIKKWRIHKSDKTKKSCDRCEALNGTEYNNINDIPILPVHPNCKCYIENIEVYLLFNGKTLALIENGTVIKSWMAMSGKPGYQGEQYTGVKDKGPLPAGKYKVSPSQVQRLNLKDEIRSYAGYLWGKIPGNETRGTWPAGRIAWGKERIWLTPDEENDMKGRDGFSIHGGWVLGSSGCIDLTGNMSDFLKIFEEYDAELELRVEY